MTRYFARINGRQEGPFTIDELRRQGIDRQTWVWTKGWPDWQRAGEVPELAGILPLNPPENAQQAPEPKPEKEVTPPEELEDIPVLFRRSFKYVRPERMPAAPDPRDSGMPPADWTLWAVLVTIFFFWPAGIVAIVYAAKSKSAWRVGQTDKAWDYAEKARMWTFISLSLGCIAVAVMLIALG